MASPESPESSEEFDETQDSSDRLWYGDRSSPPSFDERVVKLLAETEFPGDADIADPYRRANRSVSRALSYQRCSRFWIGLRCKACKVEGRSDSFAYRQVVHCHLRGCPRCGHTVRVGLVNRYLSRLVHFKRRLLRHVILPYRWVGEASVNLYDWLLKCVSKLWKSVGWRGGVSCVELKEEYNGEYYMHVHCLAVSDSYDYSAIGNRWFELTGSRGVKFKQVYSQGGLLWYILGYVFKDWIREFEDAGRYVSVMRALHGKRLLRAFGCLYGRRKSALGKPSGGGSLRVESGAKRRGRVLLLRVATSRRRWCVRCVLVLSGSGLMVLLSTVS